MNTIATTEIVAYNEFRAQLAELREYNDKAVFDYKTKKGNQEARSHIHKLRKTKSAVDACRKKEKQASLEYGRKVDGEAKSIIAEIQDMIDIHQTPLLEIERKEKERVDTILDRIEDIRTASEPPFGAETADYFRSILDSVNGEEITEEFYQEFTEQAAGAKAITVEALKQMIEKRQKYEDEQAELARLRKAEQAREQKERDERIAKEAAERAEKQAEERAKRAQEDAARRERQLEQEKAFAIQEKKEAEARALRARQEAEEQARREAEERKRLTAEEKAKREANKRHVAKINRDAKAALMDTALLTDAKAKLVIQLIANGQIPCVAIQY